MFWVSGGGRSVKRASRVVAGPTALALNAVDRVSNTEARVGVACMTLLIIYTTLYVEFSGDSLRGVSVSPVLGQSGVIMMANASVHHLVKGGLAGLPLGFP